MNMETILTDGQRQLLIERLFAEKASCVICNGGDVRVFRERGIKDLYRLLCEEPVFLRGAFVADRVVGKGAAALMILGGVAEVFADVISRPARDLFEEAHVRVDCRLETDHIVNRTKTGWCPVETLCRDCGTARECLPLIRKFIEKQA